MREVSIVAENTKRIINERGLKQKAVAAKAGYTVKAFSNLMTARKIMTDQDIQAISEALEVSPNDLFRRIDA